MTKRLFALFTAIVLVLSAAVIPAAAAEAPSVEITSSVGTNIVASSEAKEITFSVILNNPNPAASDIAGMNFDLKSSSDKLVLSTEATSLTTAFGDNSATYYAPRFTALKLNGLYAAPITETTVTLITIKATLAANAPAGKYTIYTENMKISDTAANAVYSTNVSLELNVTAAPVSVTGVSLDVDNMTLYIGGSSATLIPTVEPSGADNKNVTWSVAPEGIVTVDANGKVTPCKVGTAVVTVTTADGGFTDTCTVTVNPKEITITEDDITIADAGEYTGSPLTPGVTVDGLSSDDYVVSYSNNTNAGNSASVTVSPAPNGQYTFTPVTKNFTIDKADQTIDADDITVVVGAGEVTFNFQAEGDISISVDGTVPAGTTVDLRAKRMTVGHNAGTFKLTLNAAATSNYNAATKQITVVISEKSNANVSFNDAHTSKTYGDAAFNLNATAANTGNNGAWTWTSSNTDVLTVNNTGKVTVVGAGKATITAKYESDTTIGSATVEITVEKAAQSIAGSHITVEVGETVDLSNVFSAQGTLSYSISNGATISGNILTAGNTPGTYDLTVSAAETANYKAATKGFTVTVKEEEADDPIIPPIVTKYTLTFDTNGGSALASVTKIAGSVIDLSDFVTTKSGYEFAGWYADKALTEKVTSVKLTKNMTVYAKWTEISVGDDPCDGGANCPTNYFTDVDQSQWYHEGIDFVVENDMMKGVGNNKFDPHGVTSRAMIVTILYRLEGEPTVSGENPFSDVANGTWYTDAVIWAEANGIVNGYGDGKFGPNDDITREQMAKIMYNYAEYKGYDVSARASLASFSDAGKISSWATEEMQWAVAVGLINGMGDGTVAPQGDAERCQVAAIFMRFCDKYVK